MRNKILIGIIGALFVLSIVVYAYGKEGSESSWGWNAMMVNGYGEEEMDNIHDYMTQNLDPELKEDIDTMHEGCMGNFLEVT